MNPSPTKVRNERNLAVMKSMIQTWADVYRKENEREHYKIPEVRFQIVCSRLILMTNISKTLMQQAIATMLSAMEDEGDDSVRRLQRELMDDTSSVFFDCLMQDIVDIDEYVNRHLMQDLLHPDLPLGAAAMREGEEQFRKSVEESRCKNVQEAETKYYIDDDGKVTKAETNDDDGEDG